MAVKALCLVLLIAACSQAQTTTFTEFSDFTKGFFYGADQNPCIDSLCETQYVPSFLAQVEGIYFNFYAAWQKLYTDCQLVNLGNGIETLETSAGLEAAAFRVLYNIGRLVMSYDLVEAGCTANYTFCGEMTGNFVSLLTGWELEGPITLKSVDEHKFDHLIEGVLEGFGNQDMLNIKDSIAKLILVTPRLQEDIDAIDEVFAEIIKIKNEVKKGLNLPTIDTQKIAINVMLHMSDFTNGMIELEECTESKACGITLGKLIALAIN